MTDQLVAPDPVVEPLPALRPIQYLGSKLRLLDEIAEVVDAVDPERGRACDLFAGSGVVAAHLARSRAVVAVDIQEYSRVVCSALLSPNEIDRRTLRTILARAEETVVDALASGADALVRYERRCSDRARDGVLEPLCEVLESGSLLASEMGDPPPARLGSVLEGVGAISRDRDLVTTRYYGGVYFSYFQALQIDGLLGAVRALPLATRDVGLAAVLSTASELVTSVGSHFAQPVRPRGRDGEPKASALAAAVRRRQLDGLGVFKQWVERYAAARRRPAAESVARCADYRDFLRSYRGELSVIYADPPYTRDHYSRFYHLLETMALGDTPEVSLTRANGRDKPSRGLYRVERHQSPFCIKTQAPGAFAELFEGARRFDAPLVLSYSPYAEGSGDRPRLMTVAGIVAIAERSYRDVDVVSARRMAHSKFNASHLNGKASHDAAEVLIICRP